MLISNLPHSEKLMDQPLLFGLELLSKLFAWVVGLDLACASFEIFSVASIGTNGTKFIVT